jgi:hypothetical protein
MRGGKFTLESDLGPLEIPVEQVVKIDFGGAMSAENAVARIALADGTNINVDAFHWDGHELSAHSATLGDLRLPGGLVTELIYTPTARHAPVLPEPKKRSPKDSPSKNRP